MNKFLPNLLIVIAFGLCAFNAVQWVREGKLYGRIQVLTDEIQKKKEVIQGLEGAVKRTETEVHRLEGIRNTLNETIKTNRIEVANLIKQLDKVEKDLDIAERQGQVYKEGLEKANENIRRQNEDIKKQNEDLKSLIEDRNELAERYKKLASDYNGLVAQWNQQQEELAKAAQAQAQGQNNKEAAAPAKK